MEKFILLNLILRSTIQTISKRYLLHYYYINLKSYYKEKLKQYYLKNKEENKEEHKEENKYKYCNTHFPANH